MSDGKVIIDTSLNNKGFIRGIGSMKSETNGLTASVKKLGAAIGVAFGVKALVEFGKASIDLGSNIAEVQNVVDVAFGDMAYKIEDFAKTSIQSFGMSKLAAKKTASTYMAMARGMGMAEGQSSDMAIALTGLTGDVASFFNISQELADVKLKSVFTGETETLKDLGVVMTQTNLKAYALSKGITKNLESMSQAEMVSLRYKFVVDQLALAHGDFARTSDSWANQTRILSEQWKEFMSIVGQALITVLRPLVKTLNQIVSAMIDTANAVNSAITALFGGASAQMQQTQQSAQSVGGAIEGSVEDQESLTDAVKETNKEEKKSLAAFDEINKLAGKTGSSAEAATPSEPSSGGITTAEGKEVEGLSKKMTALLESLRAAFQELRRWITDFFRPFQEAWDTYGTAVIHSVKAALANILGLLKSISTAFMTVWTSGTGADILGTILSIIRKIVDIVGTLAERFRIAWEANGNGEAIWQAILNIIKSVVNFVDRLVSATLNWVQGLNLEPIVSSFRRFLEALQPVVDLILDGLAWGYENVLLPLASWVIEKAAPAAMDLLTAAIEAITPVIEALQPFALWLWQDFLQPLGQWAGEIVIAALEGITWCLQKFSDWARENQETIRGVAAAVVALFEAFIAYYIAKNLPGIIGAVSTAFKGLSAGIAAFSPQALIAATAIAAVVVAIMDLSKCWDKMSGLQKVTAAIGAIVAVAFAAALAMGVFHTAMTMGLAVAAIVAGIAMMTLAINSAKSQAEASMKAASFSGGAGRSVSALQLPRGGLPHLAAGAVIPPNREFLAVLGDQRSGTNIEAPESLLRQIQQEGNGQIVALLNRIADLVAAGKTLQVDGQPFARLVYTANKRESSRVGVKLT